jgi:hypothetical protein
VTTARAGDDDHNGKDVDRPRPAFDPIFPQLVKEDDSPERKLIGFIGFGLYNEAKREWASEFRTREGRYPSDEDTQVYERSWTGSRKDALQNAAAQLLASYADAVVSQLEVQILRSALRGSFVRYVARSIFSAALYTLALVGLGVALLRSGVELPLIREHEPRRTTAPSAVPESPPPVTAPQAPPASSEAPPQPPPPPRPRRTQ